MPLDPGVAAAAGAIAAAARLPPVPGASPRGAWRAPGARPGGGGGGGAGWASDDGGEGPEAGPPLWSFRARVERLLVSKR